MADFTRYVACFCQVDTLQTQFCCDVMSVSAYHSQCTTRSHSPDIIHVTSIPTSFATFPFPCVIVKRKMGEQGHSHIVVQQVDTCHDLRIFYHYLCKKSAQDTQIAWLVYVQSYSVVIDNACITLVSKVLNEDVMSPLRECIPYVCSMWYK